MHFFVCFCLLVAAAIATPLESSRPKRGTCAGTCVDIKKNPSCSGYIFMNPGLCDNGLGCCLDSGPGASAPAPGSSAIAPEGAGAGASASAPGPSASAAEAAFVAAVASGPKSNGRCTGTCVDIKKKPTCSGYIRLGWCEEGYGCCMDAGPRNDVQTSDNQPKPPEVQPKAPEVHPTVNEVQASDIGRSVGTGTCNGQCVSIRTKPTCSGYIRLGRCPNGLGCCQS